MKVHIVSLVFSYHEEDFPHVTDRDSAIKEALKEMEQNPPLNFEFDYSWQRLGNSEPNTQNP